MSTMDVRGTEILLGDKIMITDDPYGWGTVVKIEEDTLHVFRVFVHLSDTVYTGGVPHYVGTETVKLIRSGRSYTVDQYTHGFLVESLELKRLRADLGMA
jgi:hypothetical protein